MSSLSAEIIELYFKLVSSKRLASAPIGDSDQPAHPQSLIKSLIGALWEAKAPTFLQGEMTDQTVGSYDFFVNRKN